MRITLTNSHLFSVGMDAMLTIFDIKDKDPKRDINELQQLKPS